MKALIIEDEPGIVNFLLRGLTSEGYKVDHVDDGAEALKLMKKRPFDVVILDLILPGISGEEILEEMRQRKDSTPVIILTSVNDVEVKTRVLNSGADDYLVKPFSFVELLARLASVLRRAKNYQPDSEELVVGDLKMIPDRHLVTRKGKTIPLRLKEYALLAYLMRNRDRVIPRSTLVEQVWDYNAQLFSNTVDSHISLLRKKINKGFKQKLIDTVHGVGYILRNPPSEEK